MGELRVGTATAQPGERAKGVIPVSTLADGSPVEIPVICFNGARPGKRIYIQALVHGVEVNPLEALRRMVMSLDPTQIRGQIVIVTVANPIAFRTSSRRTQFDLEDMNRVWPGDHSGGLSQRMAASIFEEAVLESDLLVDLHTGYSTMITHTVYGEGDPQSEELARIFGSDYLIMEERDEKWEQSRFNGKLRNVAAAHGIPSITPELGGFSRLEGTRIQAGIIGLNNVLVHYGFIDGDVILPGRQMVIRNHLTRVVANHGGIFIANVQPGQEVWETQELGFIYSPRDFSVLETVRAPFDSVVVFHTENPVVNAGDMVANLGTRAKSLIS